MPKLVEIASQGEDVIITVDGQPKARLTRADIAPGNDVSPQIQNRADLNVRINELASLRDKYCTRKAGLTVDQILQETRADRP